MTAITDGRQHWDDDVRELGYQLWAYAAGRNASRVADMLAAEGHDVPARTVRYWADAGSWAARASADLAAIAPDIRQQTVAELVYGGLEAARGLRAVVQGEEIADKVRVAAYLGMLDRGGFSPVGSNAPELPKVSVQDRAKSFRDMSAEERLDWEREQLGRDALPTKAGKRRS